MSTESLTDLKALDYPVKMEFDAEDSLFIAGFLDLPGCSASGATVAEAYERAQEAKAEWLRVTLEQGLPVPRPSRAQEYSGRILVRLPVSLHASLSDRARINGASLNQYIVHLLSAGLVGDEVSRKLDAVATQLQRIELRAGTGVARHLGAIPCRTTEQSGLLGSVLSQYHRQLLAEPFQGTTPPPMRLAGSALESARPM